MEPSALADGYVKPVHFLISSTKKGNHMSRNSRARRKYHAARRRANRLRRKAAETALARKVGTTAAVRDAVPDAADAYGAGRAAEAPCAVGCALALAAAAALLVWYAWFK